MLKSVALTVMVLGLAPALGLPAQSAGTQGQPSLSAPLRAVLDAYYGRRSRQQRIVGGNPTPLDQHPWQVALVASDIPENDKAQFCGGSIVAARWVLTAAHCVDGGTAPVRIAVLNGTADLLTGGTRFPAAQIIVHEDWNKIPNDSDIALLRLNADLVGTPITGETASDPALVASSLVTISGWGALSWRDVYGSTTLQAGVVHYIPPSVCASPASYPSGLTANMLCAGEDDGSVDSCGGDSGGPATNPVGRTTKLVGIVSWGDGCGLPKKFGVYTRVSRFVKWVHDKTAGAVSW